MSESEQESTPDAIDDDQLPDDLVPGDDNPLAEGLEPGETVDDLLTGGKAKDDPEAEVDEGEPSQDGDDGAS